MMRKQIKIKCVDMPAGYQFETYSLIRLLKEKYDVVYSDNPDYLIASCYSREHLNYQNCIKIFWTGECIAPDFNLFDYAIGFDYLDFGDRYFRMPLYYFYTAAMKQALLPRGITMAELKNKKTEFANFVYSNGDADPFRESLFDAMSKYKPILSGGRYKNNIGDPVKNKMELLEKCKFTIACENSQYLGYTTEKILEAFAGNTIPIYWGNPLVEKEINGKAFINCYRYNSIEDVVKEVKRIDQNDELYLSMLQENVFIEGIVERKVEEFKKFFFHIFEQDYNEAGRRNRSFWGRIYVERQINDSELSTLWAKKKDILYVMKFMRERCKKKLTIISKK